MLKILSKEQQFQQPCALLLGGFDGLHAGHMTLFAAALETGYPIGIMSITGGKSGGDVFTFAEREYIYSRAGASFALEIPFTEKVKNTPAESFARGLFKRIRAAAVFCGEDFRFGKDALGTPALLERFAPCPVHVLPIKTANGEKVAVSTIKTLLSEGRMEAVNRLLACDYFVQGAVEHGRQVGRQYGFPTLNLSFPVEKFPIQEGVYGGYVETGRGTYLSIINFGARPTFGVVEKKAEAYLDGFQGDLYGETVRLFPTEFYRPITKFLDADALKTQLEKDIQRLKRGV